MTFQFFSVGTSDDCHCGKIGDKRMGVKSQKFLRIPEHVRAIQPGDSVHDQQMIPVVPVDEERQNGMNARNVCAQEMPQLSVIIIYRRKIFPVAGRKIDDVLFVGPAVRYIYPIIVGIDGFKVSW